MKSKLLYLFITLFLCACSNMKTEKELLSENPPVPSSSIEVQSVLTKYHYVRGGDFQFKIFPITKSFILSELNQIKKLEA